MQLRRERRYNQKIEIINERIENINEWLSNYSLEDFMVDIKTKLATLKALQEIIEAMMDILAMLTSDLELCSEDDYTNIEKLQKKNILNKDFALFLKKANGLRNRIIHEYNAISEPIIFSFIKEELCKFKEIVKVIKSWIKKI